MIPEKKPIAHRRICPYQGESHPNVFVLDENTPCLICSGDVISLEDEKFICPFIAFKDNFQFSVFRDNVNMDYITEVEKTFAKMQENKIKTGGSGWITVSV